MPKVLKHFRGLASMLKLRWFIVDTLSITEKDAFCDYIALDFTLPEKFEYINDAFDDLSKIDNNRFFKSLRATFYTVLEHYGDPDVLRIEPKSNTSYISALIEKLGEAFN